MYQQHKHRPDDWECIKEGTGDESWSCYFFSNVDPYPYVCSGSDTLSGSTCTSTYRASTRYKCSVSGKYYTTKAAATTGCTNYCANGSLYNSKCYYMS